MESTLLGNNNINEYGVIADFYYVIREEMGCLFITIVVIVESK